MADSVARNKFVLVGRVDSVKQLDSGKFIYEVRLPSPSEYDPADTVEVHASRKVADKGEFVNLPVRVRGFIRTSKFPDKTTGEERRGRFSSCWFELDAA